MTTILVAVDGSARATGVFNAAAGLARALNGRAVIYRALEASPDFAPPGATGVDPLPAYLEGAARTQLMALAATAPHVQCDLRIEGASQPWRSILAAADAVDADLIVVGSKGMQGTRRILGSVPNTVAHNAACHVLVAKTS